MFQIYKDRAQKTHENIFFDKFANSLSFEFNKRNLAGVLLGFPRSRKRDDLQIDALLISNCELTIIDFKDYEGDLHLPPEEEWNNGKWEVNSNIEVNPGYNSPNPFKQLGKQRYKLRNLLLEKVKLPQDDEKILISTMACFHGPIKLLGDIPRKYSNSFFIADTNNFSVKLRQIAEKTFNIDLLDPNILENILSLFYEAPEWNRDSIPNDRTPIIPVHSETYDDNKNDQISESLYNSIQAFIRSDSKVMIITGSIGSNKSAPIKIARDIAFNLGFQEARLMAISNRVKNNLKRKYEDVESLYSAIYDFSSTVQSAEEPSKRIIPLKSIEYFFEYEENSKPSNKETLFVVEESQMITNSFREDPLIRFGSGKLLSDIIEYLEIDKDSCPNKVIFIGDKFQVSFGSWEESALNKNFYKDLDVVEIELPDTESPTLIQETCLEVAECIRKENFNSLYIHNNDSVSITLQENESKILDQYNDIESKILVYSNKTAKEINFLIKERVLKNGNKLAIGDLVLIDNQINAIPVCLPNPNDDSLISGSVYNYDMGQLINVESGTFGEILSVDNASSFHSPGNIDDEGGNPIKLSFVKTQLKLINENKVIETYILENFLLNGSSKLDSLEEQEYQAYLKSLLNKHLQDHPFARGNPYFDKMITDSKISISQNSGYTTEKNGVYQLNKKGDYRDPNNASILTKYEKEYRQQELRKLSADHNSLYFKVLNTARIKYGWCMTVHKAMSYEWEKVALVTNDGNRGRSNLDYFKWLYTGFSRATHQIDLLGWKPISQFEKTVIGKALNVPNQRDYIWEVKDDCSDIKAFINEQLQMIFSKTDLKISETVSHNFQEQITVNNALGKTAILSFYYNKKGKVNWPRYQSGDKSLFARIVNIIKQRLKDNEINIFSPLNPLYDQLSEILDNTKIQIIKGDTYQDVVTLSKNTDATTVQIWHSDDLNISRFNFVSGNEDFFDNIVSKIRSYYGID